MVINNISCPDTVDSFNNAVWLYGAMGTRILDNSTMSEPQRNVVISTWSQVATDVEDDNVMESEIDEKINSFYDDFVKAK